MIFTKNDSDKIRVVVIYSSPREYGSSAKISRYLEEFLRDLGAEVKVFNVFNMRIEPCLGCVSDDVKLCRFPCVIDDDARKIFEAIDESIGLIIVSPIYWYNVPGPLKNLIDRLTVFENEIFISGRSRLEGKVVGFVVVGNDTGSIAVLQNLMITMNSMGAVIPPWAIAYHTSEEDPFNKPGFVMDLANVARTVYLMSKLMIDTKSHIINWYNASEEFRKKSLDLAEKINKIYEDLYETERNRRIRWIQGKYSENLATKISTSRY
ncbi:MAG: flavodoxin family protein [Sulfolobales archaeon]